MPDFWRSSGYHLLEKDPAGRLRVTDDFLRAYYPRPEIHPVEESCDAEHALHEALMHEPRRTVAPTELEAVADADARQNYRILIRFRDRCCSSSSWRTSSCAASWRAATTRCRHAPRNSSSASKRRA